MKNKINDQDDEKECFYLLEFSSLFVLTLVMLVILVDFLLPIEKSFLLSEETKQFYLEEKTLL